jgi:hypothetical protein
MGLWYWNEVSNELFCDAKTREMFGAPVDGEVTLETFYRRYIQTTSIGLWTWRYALQHGLPASPAQEPPSSGDGTCS